MSVEDIHADGGAVVAIVCRDLVQDGRAMLTEGGKRWVRDGWGMTTENTDGVDGHSGAR